MDTNRLTKNAADKLEEAADALRNYELEPKLKQMIKCKEEMIQDHPIPSVLVGIGVGILIGALACKHYYNK